MLEQRLRAPLYPLDLSIKRKSSDGQSQQELITIFSISLPLSSFFPWNIITDSCHLYQVRFRICFLRHLLNKPENRVTHFWFGFSPITNFLIAKIPSPFFLAAVAVALLFASILIFRKLISGLLKAKSPEVFSRFFFKSQLKSFIWGLLTTAAIRSSTITTSVVVPIVAQKIVKLKQAAPFILGANIGTTITAFIAAFLNSNTSSGLKYRHRPFFIQFYRGAHLFPDPCSTQAAAGPCKLDG